MTLWQAVIEFIVRCGVTSEPWGRDKGRIEELFAQLYLLGERPSADEVRAYMRGRWPQQSKLWQDAIIKLWRKRLSKPAHQPASVRRQTGWSHPFTIPEMLVEQHGLTPIGERLLDALAEAAADYLRAVDEDPGAASGSDAAEVYSLTANALRMWALSRDRIDDLAWPSVITSRRGLDGLAIYGTRTGRRREQTRIEELVRRYQAEHPPRGSDHLDDEE